MSQEGLLATIRRSYPVTAFATRRPSRPFQLLVRDPPGAYGPMPTPRLLDQVQCAIRARHMSPRTEEAYVQWIARYILSHGKRHPAEMGPPEITAFLTALAVRRHVSASRQNQALPALLFLYREVIGCDPGRLDGVVRANAAAASSGGADAARGRLPVRSARRGAVREGTNALGGERS